MKVYNWKKGKEIIIEKELFKYSQNKAFLLIYNETDFKEVFENSKDNVLDEIFLKLVTAEEYFNDEEDLESSMEKVYTSRLREEIFQKSKGNGIESKLRTLMKDIMRQKLYYSELAYLCPK